MKGWIKFSLMACLALPVGAGCAISLPASEIMMFRSEEESETNDGKASQFDHFGPEQLLNRKGVATNFDFPFRRGHFQFSFRPRLKAELEFARDKFSDYIGSTFSSDTTLTADNLIVRNPYYLSYGIPVTLMTRQTVKWNLNIGVFTLGSDLTAKLSQKTYLTVNLGYGDGELIAQQKVIDRSDFGIALGAFYRTERRGFDIIGDEIDPTIIFGTLQESLVHDRVFYNHYAGGRTFIFLPIDEQSYVHCFISTGYAFNLHRAVVNFGLGIRWRLF